MAAKRWMRRVSGLNIFRPIVKTVVPWIKLQSQFRVADRRRNLAKRGAVWIRGLVRLWDPPSPLGKGGPELEGPELEGPELDSDVENFSLRVIVPLTKGDLGGSRLSGNYLALVNAAA